MKKPFCYHWRNILCDGPVKKLALALAKQAAITNNDLFGTKNILKVIALVYMDGHPVLTHLYSIYKNISTEDPEYCLRTIKKSNQILTMRGL